LAADPGRLALGEQVRQTRARLSYRVAAERVGVSATTLRRLEQGQSVGTASLVRVLRWLGIWPRTWLWAPRLGGRSKAA
jgi:transcriptional regulator with XRE-family HTH domain